jgi:hypothetical protein
MNRRTKLAAAIALACCATLAQATTYDVSAVFYDGGVQGVTTFDGSFDWNSSTGTVSNFTGMLSESMWAWDTAKGTFTVGNNGVGMKATGYTGEVYSKAYTENQAPLLNLTYQLASSTSGNLVTVSTFLQNNTDVVSGGGYDVVSTDNAMAYGWNGPLASDHTSRNYNGFFTLVFDKTDPTNTSATFNQIVYGDETSLGMMGPMLTGWLGMTGYGDGSNKFGSMGGYPMSLTIAQAVPEPETYAMMMAGLGLVGFMSRRRKTFA